LEHESSDYDGSHEKCDWWTFEEEKDPFYKYYLGTFINILLAFESFVQHFFENSNILTRFFERSCSLKFASDCQAKFLIEILKTEVIVQFLGYIYPGDKCVPRAKFMFIPGVLL